MPLGSVEVNHSLASKIVRDHPQLFTDKPDLLLNTLKANNQKGIHNLQTSLCGWTSVLTLMYLTQSNPKLRFVSIDSANSGDEPNWGELSRVVGYRAIVLTNEIIK